MTGQDLSNTDYIQPQWICDSINFSVLLPIREYLPGAKLPPHLSPFTDFKQSDFIPNRLKEIRRIKGEVEEWSVDEEEQEDTDEKQPIKENKSTK